MSMAKNRKSVSETANPESSDENEFLSWRLSSTRKDSKVPTMPKMDMVVSATPSM